jgi:hypothetical protein
LIQLRSDRTCPPAGTRAFRRPGFKASRRAPQHHELARVRAWHVELQGSRNDPALTYCGRKWKVPQPQPCARGIRCVGKHEGYNRTCHQHRCRHQNLAPQPNARSGIRLHLTRAKAVIKQVISARCKPISQAALAPTGHDGSRRRNIFCSSPCARQNGPPGKAPRARLASTVQTKWAPFNAEGGAACHQSPSGEKQASTGIGPEGLCARGIEGQNVMQTSDEDAAQGGIRWQREAQMLVHYAVRTERPRQAEACLRSS